LLYGAVVLTVTGTVAMLQQRWHTAPQESEA
jgi:hypothetical protein